jgi:signal transduction histidine kinase
MLPAPGGPPAALAAAAERLADEMNADVSVYGADGTLAGSRGLPIGLAASERERFGRMPRVMRIDLADGRVVLARWRPPGPGPGLRILSIMLIVAGAIGLTAFPVAARLTRRLEALRSGVERWGAGGLSLRVDDQGDDEVAVVARTFNAAAARIEQLMNAQKALLANASHEVRSPLARLRVAVELWLADPRPDLHAEILRDLAESEQLVDEILLASRLDHDGSTTAQTVRVDLLGLAAEEAARLEAGVASVSDGADAVEIDGDATLLRRLIRNLLENAARHGRPPIHIAVARVGRESPSATAERGSRHPNGNGCSSRSTVRPGAANLPAAGASASRWCARSRAGMAGTSSATRNPAAAAGSWSIWRRTRRRRRAKPSHCAKLVKRGESRPARRP